MALLMPDINLRRAKRHLERYWRQLLGGDRAGERLIFRSVGQAKATIENAKPAEVDVAPPLQNLDPDPEMEKPTVAVVGDCNRKPDARLDCRSLSVAINASSNQDQEDTEKNEAHRELNQVSIISSASVGKAECSGPQTELQAGGRVVASNDNLKPGSQPTPSSTSTTGTLSTVSSVASVTFGCEGKPSPPLSIRQVSNNGQEGMLPPTHTSRVQGPTLGSILQRVHLNDGNVSELDFSTLAQRNKQLGSEGCALVARSLSTNHTVRKLVIRDHAIGDDGAIALSKMLCNNTTLEYLDLYGNEIGVRGAEALAQALYGHDSLTHLCLRSNLITDLGAEALAQAIRCNCTLKSVELVQNRITKVGALALLDALDVNLHLETVNLESNDVPAFVTSQLAAALARNRAESLILESHAAEKKAEKIVRRASGMETQDEDEDGSSELVDEEWEDDDSESVSSGFLTCSGVTDIPLSSSGLWI